MAFQDVQSMGRDVVLGRGRIQTTTSKDGKKSSTAIGCCVYNGEPFCIIQNVSGGGLGTGIVNSGGGIRDIVADFTNAMGTLGNIMRNGANATSSTLGDSIRLNTQRMGLGNDTVILPLPSNISMDLSGSWSDGDMLENIKEGAQGVTDAVKKGAELAGIKGSSAGGGGLIGKAIDMIGGAGSTIGGMLGDVGKAGIAFGKTAGIAYIGQKELQYDGPEFREFRMSWTLAPRNWDDFNNITIAIRKLKRWVAPNGRSAIVEYPPLVQFGFSSEISGVPASLPSRLTSINVSFGGSMNGGGAGGMVNMINGAGATAYNVTVVIKEAMYLTQTDIDMGI